MQPEPQPAPPRSADAAEAHRRPARWAQRLWNALRRIARRQSKRSDRPTVDRAAVEAVLGMPVQDLALFERALRHRSVLRGQPDSHLRSNERLEFLGDAVLGLAVAERLFVHFPDRDEGFLTRTRAKLVNGKTLADFAVVLGLPDLVLVSAHMSDAEGRRNPTVLADAFEAVLGALYLDQGLSAARQFVHRVLDENVDLEEVAETRSNFKSVLLEHAQAHGWGQPEYRVIAEEGPSHDRRFTVEAWVDGAARGTGAARSKKQAEQQAAREALQALAEAA